MTTLNPPRTVGLDVGGANVKYASSDNLAASRVFPLWRRPDELSAAIVDDLEKNFAVSHSNITTLAVTMTGELADCFLDRSVGVQHIVSHVTEAAQRSGVREVVFYGVDGMFHETAAACRDPDLIAAANWHALANFVAREIASDTTLIDIGSTTTDIIPIANGQVATDAMSDHDRLLEGSLVYVGCRRTPVCALVDELSFRGRSSPVMNEVFATIDDAMLILGMAAEDPNDDDSADGKARTRSFAANRLARMIGLDQRSVGVEDAELMASQVVDAATSRIHDANRRIAHGSSFVVSGHGTQLLQLPSESKIIRLSQRLGPEVARCAPAYAVARLQELESNGALR